MSRILVIGSAILDHVAYTERFAKPGESLVASSFAVFPGGKGANQAVAAARLGAEVSFCGCVGDDVCGQSLTRSLQENNIDLKHLQIESGATSGAAVITVNAEAQNQIVVCPGANMSLRQDTANKALSEPGVTTLLMQLEVPAGVVEGSLRMARERGIRTVLNPAPACEVSEDLWSLVDVAIPNETETEFYSGSAPNDLCSLRIAAEWFVRRGTRAVVITLGSRGCFVSTGDEGVLVQPHPVDAIDPTAAGDAFCGAIGYFLGEGLSLLKAAERANVVGALSATRPGAQASLPDRLLFESAWLSRSYVPAEPSDQSP